MKIQISKNDLNELFKNGIIEEKQIESIWDFLLSKADSKPSFTGLNVAYYFGALIIISAMTWFATEAFAKYNSAGLFFVGVLYFIMLFLYGRKLYKVKQTQVPGGLLLTSAVFMVPLIVFSIQDYLDLWGFETPGHYRDYYIWIKSGWFFMEVTAIIVGLLFIKKYDFPFLTFPIAFSLWLLSMDITPIIFGSTGSYWEQRRIVSLLFGLVILIFTYFIDRKTEKDYAFWLYLFGLLCFWGGLSTMNSDSELNKFLYCCINLLLIVISVLFNRKAFIVFGSLGVYGYLFHLSDIVFRDSLLFPVALSFFGVAIIWLGVKYKKNEEKVDAYINSILPSWVIKFLPPNRV
ncbi:MAG: hypothetical protein ACEPOW_14225 [Bacteroidales bacterium]